MRTLLYVIGSALITAVGPSGGVPGGSGAERLPLYEGDGTAIVSMCYNRKTIRVRNWRVPEMIAIGATAGTCK